MYFSKYLDASIFRFLDLSELKFSHALIEMQMYIVVVCLQLVSVSSLKIYSFSS